MRYVRIPPTEKIELSPPTKTEPAKILEYSLAKMVDEYVWTLPKFRSDRTGLEDRCADVIKEASAGDLLELEDDDHKVIADALTDAPPFNPAFARKLNRIARSFILAAREKPKDATANGKAPKAKLEAVTG